MNHLNTYKGTNTKGFTLIEVLVASVILFSSIATVSMIYRGAFISSDKANQQISVTGLVPIILANVREEIRSKSDSDDTEMAKQSSSGKVKYSWQAVQVAHKGAPSKLDVDSGEYISPAPKYKLWLVNLELSYKTTIKNYQFYEVSWSHG